MADRKFQFDLQEAIIKLKMSAMDQNVSTDPLNPFLKSKMGLPMLVVELWPLMSTFSSSRLACALARCSMITVDHVRRPLNPAVQRIADIGQGLHHRVSVLQVCVSTRYWRPDLLLRLIRF